MKDNYDAVLDGLVEKAIIEASEPGDIDLIRNVLETISAPSLVLLLKEAATEMGFLKSVILSGEDLTLAEKQKVSDLIACIDAKLKELKL